VVTRCHYVSRRFTRFICNLVTLNPPRRTDQRSSTIIKWRIVYGPMSYRRDKPSDVRLAGKEGASEDIHLSAPEKTSFADPIIWSNFSVLFAYIYPRCGHVQLHVCVRLRVFTRVYYCPYRNPASRWWGVHCTNIQKTSLWVPTSLKWLALIYMCTRLVHKDQEHY